MREVEGMDAVRRVVPGGLERAVSELRSRSKAPGAGSDFERILREVMERGRFKLSAHAQMRLRQRGIVLTAEDVRKIGEAIDKAGEKGARESLVLTDKAAFLVNVKNRTIITALDGESMRERVFTNIDSAIII
ncbi:hypothetical protein DRP77_05185 [Candidatus Poribacteria bacterium]|nr:MAG: hypothetical protein DRP77_05185 [Candidatus Poribacteria bacterium]